MNSDPLPLKHIRRLIVALTISGIFNIFLCSLLFYWLIKDTPPSPYFEQKPALKQQQEVPIASEKGNVEWIHYFRTLSFEQLVSKLSNQQLIENGYTQRDAALACLMAFHHFDLARALVGYPFPDQRSIVYGQLKNGNPALITVYPDLSDAQFQAIIDFATKERWPLTSKGIFWRLKKFKEESEASLVQAFEMTPEFLAVELLFNRAEVQVSKSELQKMLLEGTWKMLSEFTEQQKLVQDLSPAKRQRFLIEYIDNQSKAAAYLMLKTDRDFALKKLDDRHVVALLELLNEKTPESHQYALDLLTSPRSNNVWKTAGELLYLYAGEKAPEKNLHQQAMKRFMQGQEVIEVSIPLEKPVVKNVPLKSVPPKSVVVPKQTTKTVPPKVTKNVIVKKDRLYIVQEGDSLWKISRRFNVDMDTLRDHNKLKSDALKPGSPLRIPI